MTEKKTSQEWQELNPNIEVLDPDGWDRTNFQYSWHEELITKEEYEKRLMLSTVEEKVSPPAPAAEPKKGKELHCAECGQYLPTALTHHDYEQCQAYKAQFQPQVAALTQKVKELEKTRHKQVQGLLDNHRLILNEQTEKWERLLADERKKVAALESQLKPVSGWEETVLKESEQRDMCLKKMGIYANSPGSYEQDQCLLSAQAELTWRKARQGMVELDENQDPPELDKELTFVHDRYYKAGFRRVKALSSSKGEGK